MAREHRSFADFWPFYLREHSRPRTRALHYAGTSLVVAIALVAAVTGRWLWLLAVPIAGYGFAWLAHFAVEKNRPATFTYPLWSLAADFKMWWLWLTGRLGRELERAGVRSMSVLGVLILTLAVAAPTGPVKAAPVETSSAATDDAAPAEEPPPKFLPMPQDIADLSERALFDELTEKLVSGDALEPASTLAALDAALVKLREPTPLRGLVQYARAGALMHLERFPEATDAIEESIRLLPDYSAPLITGSMVHAYSNRSGAAADYLIRASFADPVSVRAIDDYEINNIVQRLTNDGAMRRVEALSDRLITIGWVGSTLSGRSALARDAIKGRLNAQDLDGARQLVPKLIVPDHARELLISNSYQAIWPDIDQWAGNRLEKLWPMYLGEAKARWSASKDTASAQDYIFALERAGHDRTLTGEFAPRFRRLDAKADYDLIFVAGRVADAFARQGRWAEGIKLFEAAQKVWPLEDDPNALNIIANQAKFELYQGKLSDALAHMDLAIAEARKRGAEINTNALGSMHQIRACILAELGRPREASTAAVLAAPFQTPDRTAHMQLCIGNQAGAKKTLLVAFEDAANREHALDLMQLPGIDWPPGDYADRLRARYAQLKADPELLRAVARYGRILPYRAGEAAPAEAPSPRGAVAK